MNQSKHYQQACHIFIIVIALIPVNIYLRGFSWFYVTIEVGCIGLALICYRMYKYYDYLEMKDYEKVALRKPPRKRPTPPDRPK